MKRLAWTLCLFVSVAPALATANREIFSLERFDASRLVVWNIVEKKDSGDSFAYVRDPDGYIHHLGVGEYLGIRNGRVTRIDHCGIGYTELMPDAAGSFEERAQVVRPQGRLPEGC